MPSILVLIVIITVLGFNGALLGNAGAVNPSGIDQSQAPPPNVGSINQYMENNSDKQALPSYLPVIGIHVFAGGGKLASGQQLVGLSVKSVDRPGPGDDAGIKAEHIRVLRATAEVGLGVILVGATLFFPPAILGVPLIERMDSSTANDVIVAVDAERTRNIGELEDSLRNVRAGEIIYLTIVRDGQRKQLRVLVPAIFDPHSPTSQRVLPE
jgi:S1-C subfamily serine protease